MIPDQYQLEELRGMALNRTVEAYLLNAAADEITRLRAEIAALKAEREWQPIATAPRDRLIIVHATEPRSPPPECGPLPPLVCLCQWHPDGGFCVCEIREPTHWMEYVPPTPLSAP